jgi:hypothetical protein
VARLEDVVRYVRFFNGSLSSSNSTQAASSSLNSATATQGVSGIIAANGTGASKGAAQEETVQHGPSRRDQIVFSGAFGVNNTHYQSQNGPSTAQLYLEDSRGAGGKNIGLGLKKNLSGVEQSGQKGFGQAGQGSTLSLPTSPPQSTTLDIDHNSHNSRPLSPDLAQMTPDEVRVHINQHIHQHMALHANKPSQQKTTPPPPLPNLGPKLNLPSPSLPKPLLKPAQWLPGQRYRRNFSRWRH